MIYLDSVEVLMDDEIRAISPLDLITYNVLSWIVTVILLIAPVPGKAEPRGWSMRRMNSCQSLLFGGERIDA